MSIVSIIDSTLRDGGYLNNWDFSEKFQFELIQALINANAEIIECGFISNKSGNDLNGTCYKSIEKINNVLRGNAFNNSASKFAVMMRPEEYNVADLPQCNKAENCITIIRVMLYQHEIKDSVDILKQIVEKGYELHIQPTIISKYSDEEVVKMIEGFKSVKYKAISIVDTFGSLNEISIKKITLLFDKYVNKNAIISLHCHNNLSKAYQNALAFISSVDKKRDVYVDTAVNGLGRGAGNLQTEVFMSYLKNEKNMKYSISPIKAFCEENMRNFNRNIFEKDFYAYIITAQKNMHPNYATYLLLNKYSQKDIRKILELISEEKYESFDFEYIKSLCEVYMIKL